MHWKDICRDRNGPDVCDGEGCDRCVAKAAAQAAPCRTAYRLDDGMKLRVRIYWNVWAIPLGVSIGDESNKFVWAVSIGPIHFVNPKPGFDFERQANDQ